MVQLNTPYAATAKSCFEQLITRKDIAEVKCIRNKSKNRLCQAAFLAHGAVMTEKWLNVRKGSGGNGNMVNLADTDSASRKHCCLVITQCSSERRYDSNGSSCC